VPALMEPVLTSRAFRENWARLIQKIYQVDPLLCPKCQGTMKIKAISYLYLYLYFFLSLAAQGYLFFQTRGHHATKHAPNQ
jgi:hypothetical protein